MSIASAITRLTAARDAIRSALVDKGVEAGEHGFEDFAADVAGISSGVKFAYVKTTATDEYPNGRYELIDGYWYAVYSVPGISETSTITAACCYSNVSLSSGSDERVVYMNGAGTLNERIGSQGNYNQAISDRFTAGDGIVKFKSNNRDSTYCQDRSTSNFYAPALMVAWTD